MQEFLQFLSEHQEAVITLLAAILGIIRVTAWGKSKADALDLIAGVIEQGDARRVKNRLKARCPQLPVDIEDAIVQAAAKADPKKKARGKALSFVSHVLRPIVPIAVKRFTGKKA